METIFVIVGIIALFIYLIAQDSKKETAKERYGEAVGTLAQMTADGISSFAHNISEPASKRELRLAKENLARRNGSLYRFDWFSDKEYLEKLLTVDEKFNESLKLLGLTEQRWMKIAYHLLYVGTIRKLSRDTSDYTKKNSESYRSHMLNDWRNDNLYKDSADMLCRSLTYFNISEGEWIKYGDTVIEMHNINDSNKDVEEFGYIVQIMPMKNNKHLL